MLCEKRQKNLFFTRENRCQKQRQVLLFQHVRVIFVIKSLRCRTNSPKKTMKTLRYCALLLLLLTLTLSAEAQTWTARSGDTNDGEFVVLRGHTDDVRSAIFSPDGKMTVTAGADQTVRIWDTGSGKELKSLNLGFLVENVFFLADGKRIATVQDNDGFRTVQIWDADPGSAAFGRELRREDRMGGSGSELAVAVSANRKKVVSNTYDAGAADSFQTWAKVWDVDTGRLQILRSQGTASNYSHFGWFAGNTLAVSPDGTRVVTVRSVVIGGCYVVVWDADSGRELRRLGASNRPIFGRQGVTPGEAIAALFSPDSSKIAVHFGDYVRIWDVRSGRELRKWEGYAGDFLPDGKKFATTISDTLQIWDVNTGRKLVALEGTKDVLFSPDGKKIVTKDDKENFRVWDSDSGRKLYELGDFPYCFSEDSKMLVVNEDGNEVPGFRILDAESGKTLQYWEGRFGALSPDGKKVTTLDGNAVRVWTLSAKST